MASTIETLLLARMMATPVARAHASAAQASVSGNQITLNVADFDNLGGFNSSGTYTVQAAGTYEIYAAAKWSEVATWVHLAIQYNGAVHAVGPDVNTATSAPLGSNCSDLIQAQVGDTFKLFANAGSSSLATDIPDGGSQDVYMTVALVAWS